MADFTNTNSHKPFFLGRLLDAIGFMALGLGLTTLAGRFLGRHIEVSKTGNNSDSHHLGPSEARLMAIYERKKSQVARAWLRHDQKIQKKIIAACTKLTDAREKVEACGERLRQAEQKRDELWQLDYDRAHRLRLAAFVYVIIWAVLIMLEYALSKYLFQGITADMKDVYLMTFLVAISVTLCADVVGKHWAMDKESRSPMMLGAAGFVVFAYSVISAAYRTFAITNTKIMDNRFWVNGYPPTGLIFALFFALNAVIVIAVIHFAKMRYNSEEKEISERRKLVKKYLKSAVTSHRKALKRLSQLEQAIASGHAQRKTAAKRDNEKIKGLDLKLHVKIYSQRAGWNLGRNTQEYMMDTDIPRGVVEASTNTIKLEPPEIDFSGLKTNYEEKD